MTRCIISSGIWVPNVERVVVHLYLRRNAIVSRYRRISLSSNGL